MSASYTSSTNRRLDTLRFMLLILMLGCKSTYIKEEKHYFPEDKAKGKGREGKGDGLLRVLLRTIDE